MLDLLKFDNTYVKLPTRFYERIRPVPVASPNLVVFNQKLATELGIEALAKLSTQELAAIFSGNKILQGAEPIAQAYAGHQFGGFVPQLGDGRAVLLGEILNNGRRYDVQLKGSGQTSFSRRGDGRAALAPMLREYIISEALHALGIPTTRSLAVVTTGEQVYREKPLPGAILTRIASSHIRVGTFEYFASRQDTKAVKLLADYAVARHYSELEDADNKYLKFLDAVIRAQAKLIAQWMSVGFIHGVMNTDNMSIAGETIDYGPCAFMNHYDPSTVFSSIDEQGRYAYGNQPAIAQWNLARLAESLLSLLSSKEDMAIDLASNAIAAFAEYFKKDWLNIMASKIGIAQPDSNDLQLIQEFLKLLQKDQVDFNYAFFALQSELGVSLLGLTSFKSLFKGREELAAWLEKWKLRLANNLPSHFTASDADALKQSALLMQKSNPAYIPRNHLVEEVLADASELLDYTKFNQLLSILSTPFQLNELQLQYLLPPASMDYNYRTFCGT